MELYDRHGKKYIRSYPDLEVLMSAVFTIMCVLHDISYVRNKYRHLEIHDHDYDRAAFIHKLRVRLKHRIQMVPDPDFHLDSVTVMFSWCYKYSKIYTKDRKDEAYEHMLHQMNKFNALSINKLKPTDREYLFNMFFHKELGCVYEY